MKKRVIVLLLTMSVAFAMAGCSKKDATETTSNKQEESVGEAGEETTKENSGNEEKEETVNETRAVLGGNAENFDGFEFLYAEELKTESEKNEETGKMENKSITVMIPMDDYASVNRDYAYVNSLGVHFEVRLNPYLQYKQEDYLVSENLQAYLDEEYDEFYSTDLKALEISDIEELDEHRACASVNYVQYDTWDDMYVPYYKAFYVNEVEKDLVVMVEVEINLAEVTGKTPKLLEEIESFYEFEIGWDKTAMEQKVADYVANNDGEDEMFSTGYLMFKLPKGWKEDTDYDDDYSTYSYAPDGDGVFSECAVTIGREFATDGDESIKALLKDTEVTKALLAEQIGDTVKNMELEDLGDTAIGRTVKMTADIEEDGMVAHCAFYFGGSKDYVYTIYAIETDHATDDAFAAAEMILETAQSKN